MSLTMPAAHHLEAYHTARTFVALGGVAATLAGTFLPAGRSGAER